MKNISRSKIRIIPCSRRYQRRGQFILVPQRNRQQYFFFLSLQLPSLHHSLASVFYPLLPFSLFSPAVWQSHYKLLDVSSLSTCPFVSFERNMHSELDLLPTRWLFNSERTRGTSAARERPTLWSKIEIIMIESICASAAVRMLEWRDACGWGSSLGEVSGGRVEEEEKEEYAADSTRWPRRTMYFWTCRVSRLFSIFLPRACSEERGHRIPQLYASPEIFVEIGTRSLLVLRSLFFSFIFLYTLFDLAKESRGTSLRASASQLSARCIICELWILTADCDGILCGSM